LNTEVLGAGEESAIARAVELIERGELVAFPTDTVYGVGADALNAVAVGRLFAAKVRPGGKPIALLIPPEYDLRRIAVDLPEDVERLRERFWPGGLTVILRRSALVPDAVTVGGSTVGVRVPDHPIALRLLREVGRPLATTSANLSGQASPRTAGDVAGQLSGRIPLILDGGACPGGVESTVVDLTTPAPTIRRLGAVSRAELTAALGRPVEA
jgi:L-threonylcarbamoyladenylate synthase